MRYHIALMFTMSLLLIVGSVHPVCAEEPQYFTLSGGWMWPVGGPAQNQYQSGPTLAASFRTGLLPNYQSGFEVGYSWFALDTDYLEKQNPGWTFTGGDFGLLSITNENDYIFGTPGHTLRPFFDFGLGFFRSFIDDAATTDGTTTEEYSTGVYKGSFFGFHAGIGTLINRDRFGLRLDANYVYLFAGGPNLEFFDVRAGFVFYLSDPVSEGESGSQSSGS